MGLRLLLRGRIPCAMCNGITELQEGVLDQDIGYGTRIIVDSVPVYRCLTCGDESMDLHSAAEIERELAPLVAQAPEAKRMVIRIHWEKRQAQISAESPFDTQFLLPDHQKLVLSDV